MNKLPYSNTYIMSYRCAGLAWDDLIDRGYDGQVKRTKNHPLRAGDISVDLASFVHRDSKLDHMAIVRCPAACASDSNDAHLQLPFLFRIPF